MPLKNILYNIRKGDLKIVGYYIDWLNFLFSKRELKGDNSNCLLFFFQINRELMNFVQFEVYLCTKILQNRV